MRPWTMHSEEKLFLNIKKIKGCMPNSEEEYFLEKKLRNVHTSEVHAFEREIFWHTHLEALDEIFQMSMGSCLNAS